MDTSSFAAPDDIARLTARMLLEIRAVHFRADEPYILTSGLASPVYIDCRKLISYPRIRATLMDFAVSTLQRDAGFEAFDAIAGGETAGIPFAAWIAERMALPMQYVRKKPKGFGRDAQIEGDIHEGQRVLLVEDLTTDGGSKVAFAEALRRAGAEVTDTLVVFYYDIFEQTPRRLGEVGLRLHYLATWRDVLAECRRALYTGAAGLSSSAAGAVLTGAASGAAALPSSPRFDERTLAEVEAFLNDPLAWSAAHGGNYKGGKEYQNGDDPGRDAAASGGPR